MKTKITLIKEENYRVLLDF